MIRIIKGITNFLIDPVNVLFLSVVISLILYYFKKNRAGESVLYSSFFLFLITASPFVPDLLIGHLERQYVPLESSTLDTNQTYQILVLGSGHTADPDVPALAQLSSTALHRLTEGIRILRLTPQARLILSGYGDRSTRAQAEVLHDAALSLGIPEERMSTQSTPSTTEEEAEAYMHSIGDQPALILVTSASHMPRAMYLFEKHGLKPIPAPAAYEILEDPTAPYSWDLFSSRNFRKVEMALHEYLGMLWARW